MKVRQINTGKISERQMNRKKKLALRKGWKKSMKKIKNLVKCSACGIAPTSGEKIDSWKIEQKGQDIKLICESCSGKGEE